MALERKNNLGTIKLNDYIFAQIVRTSISKCAGRAFHASEKGKHLGNQGLKTGIGEIASNIKIREDEKKIYLEFYIITLFGASIIKTTREILEYIEYEMRGLFPEKGANITLRIVGTKGIRTKRIAKRNIKIVKKYEA